MFAIECKSDYFQTKYVQTGKSDLLMIADMPSVMNPLQAGPRLYYVYDDYDIDTFNQQKTLLTVNGHSY